jgi:hypothetical protein
MIRTKTLISELIEVPREWVFEFYLKLPDKLTGQSLMILSPFNPKDKRPSFSIFVGNTNNYMFRDFSTNISGDSLNLVQRLFNLSTRGETAHKIVRDYNEWLLVNNNDYASREFKIEKKYKVTGFEKMGWTKLDEKYWTQFHIGSKLLEKYNVAPLSSYTMCREGEETGITISGRAYIYGFFREDGTLYKIYQPLVKDSKFIKVRDYIQGTDQLTMKTKYLVICSSLKDVMAFMKLGYKEAEAVAPDSENTLIAEHVISAYKLKYKSICIIFDNDEAGVNAMKNYEMKYGIKSALLPLSKDLSDSIRDHGIRKVQEVLTPILKEALQ